MRYAVDGILYKNNKIVLIQRGGKTFPGFWALPGGIVEEGETIERTLEREMKEELGVRVIPLEILGVYSAIERDPREHTISTVFICDFQGELEAGDDARNYGIFSIEDIEKKSLAFDHKKILQDFAKWLKKRETFWSTKES